MEVLGGEGAPVMDGGVEVCVAEMDLLGGCFVVLCEFLDVCSFVLLCPFVRNHGW